MLAVLNDEITANRYNTTEQFDVAQHAKETMHGEGYVGKPDAGQSFNILLDIKESVTSMYHRLIHRYEATHA